MVGYVQDLVYPIIFFIALYLFGGRLKVTREHKEQIMYLFIGAMFGA